MASSRRIGREFRAAQAEDLRTLPNVPRVVLSGPFGTFPEDTFGSAPEAPTLDADALYTGEYREEVDGNEFNAPPVAQTNPDIVGGFPVTVLASLRRPWPLVGFAVDVSKFTAGDKILAGLSIIMRSGKAVLVANELGTTGGGSPTIAWTVPAGPAVKNNWIAMTGINAGARVELWIQHNSEASVKVKGNLWGYNSPGFGP